MKHKVNKNKFLNLVVKYLKENAAEEETFLMHQHLQVIFNKGHQHLLDFVTNKLDEQHQELLEDWSDLVEFWSSSLILDSPCGKPMYAVLFLIPVVMVIDTTMQSTDIKIQNDVFEIVKLGFIRNLMVKAGLFSNQDETISLLTRLFSFDEILAINDIEKYQLLKMFLSQNNNISFKPNKLPSKELPPEKINCKLRFIIGCAILKDTGPKSLLSEWLDPDDASNDTQIELAAKAMLQFTEELSEQLPNLLAEKTGTEITTIISSVEEYKTHGIKEGIKNFDDFNLSILLEKAIPLNNPKIKIFKPMNANNFIISLSEDNNEVFKAQLHSFFASPEEFNEYLSELYNNLEVREFYCHSINHHEAVFMRTKNPLGSFSRNKKRVLN